MNQIINDLYPLNRLAIGEGIDNAFLYLQKLIDLEMIEVPSGEEIGTWTIPNEWVVKDAWIKYKGKKIVDYKKTPLALGINSKPFSGTLDREKLSERIITTDDCPSAYSFAIAEDWVFTMPKDSVIAQKISDDGSKVESVGLLGEGDYEVLVDTEFKPGTMKVGVHTIKGKTDKEILLFAHLDYPYQANANLSGVATLVDLVKHIKPEQYEHTIKLVFGSKDFGSLIYCNKQDISKVDFVVALEAVGNFNEQGLLLQWAMNQEARINTVAHLALRGLGKGYRQGKFSTAIGSDEFIFNDPLIGIPGILLSTHNYKQYLTSEDTPDTIDERKEIAILDGGVTMENPTQKIINVILGNESNNK